MILFPRRVNFVVVKGMFVFQEQWVLYNPSSEVMGNAYQISWQFCSDAVPGKEYQNDPLKVRANHDKTVGGNGGGNFTEGSA